MKVDSQDRTAKGIGLLEDAYVNESERGSGLGTALVKEVISAARDAGFERR
jgi:GNAT superfamily N-acetyltransferase